MSRSIEAAYEQMATEITETINDLVPYDVHTEVHDRIFDAIESWSNYCNVDNSSRTAQLAKRVTELRELNDRLIIMLSKEAQRTGRLEGQLMIIKDIIKLEKSDLLSQIKDLIVIED